MASEEIIDLCDSSIDEGDPNYHRPGPSEKNTLLFNPTTCLAPHQLNDCFWDSSDEDDPISVNPRRNQQRRRKSKVVTPEDTHRKQITEDVDSSSDDDSLPDYQHQQSQRKQYRILFTKINPNGSARGSTTHNIPVKSGNRRVGPKNGEILSSTPLEQNLEESSSDDDFLPYSRVFSKGKQKVVQSRNQIKDVPEIAERSDTNNEDGEIMADGCHQSDNLEAGDIELKGHTTAGLKQVPHAFSSCQVTTAVNPYAKRPRHNNMTPSPRNLTHSTTRQVLQYPSVGPVSSRQYEDLRAKYVLALWKFSRTLVSATYNLPKLDSICRRIKDLALSIEFPIRSLEEYTGSGYSMETNTLREALRVGGVDHIKTPYNRDASVHGYYSIPEAALVAVLEFVEKKARLKGIDLADQVQMISFCREKEQWIYLSDLIPQIDSRLNTTTAPALLTRQGDDDNGEQFYTSPSTRSAEYKQLDQLTKLDARSEMPLLKSHRKDKRVCYELTLRGLEKALIIRGRHFPEPRGYLRTSKLYVDSVDPCFKGICLVVDQREGGGASNKLHSICQGLDMRKVPYVVTRLNIGDYAFVSTETQSLLPIIIERKSIQDVAQSIHDGRWVSQKLRMYQGQHVFGFDSSRLAYIIEGNVECQELTGGAIGQMQFRVSRTQLDAALGNLEAEGFEVFTTNNINGTVAKLVELCICIAHDFRNKKLDACLTYEAFMQRIQSIPKGVDFSRIAKDHKLSKLSRNVEEFIDVQKIAIEYERSSAVELPGHTTRNADMCMDKFEKWTSQELRNECEKHGLAKSGKKTDLILRLLGPRPPTVWLQRKKANLYIPARYDTCGSAILVAIWLHQRRQNSESWKGLEKEQIVTLAERLKISKDPFTGTGKGLFDYDGWSCMGPLREGRSPLVWRQKGGFFKLSTVGGDDSGFSIAGAMHEWCHQHEKCLCTELGLM